MSIRTYEHLQSTWTNFQHQGTTNDTTLSPHILQSWQRCRTAHLDAFTKSFTHAHLHNTTPYNETFLALIRPVMEDLYQFLKGTNCVMFFADQQLQVQHYVGAPELVEQLNEQGLGLTSDWREECIGTNAVHLALLEAQAYQTVAAEHFCLGLHPYACSAAPIFDMSGGVLGVLVLVGLAEEAHIHSLGMIISACHTIHNQIHNHLLLADSTQQLNKLQLVIETINDGLVFLDIQGHIIRINNRAAQLLSLSARNCIGRALFELIDGPISFRHALVQQQNITDQEMVFVTRKGATALLVSKQTIYDRGQHHVGNLISVRVPETTNNLVQQLTGAKAHFRFVDIIGESPNMQSALRHARIAANSRVPVLLLGAPGVGKEVFAQAIHNASAQSKGPFITLNCEAIPRNLLMGELLGYESEQFDDIEGRPGKIELAQGGTLLLEQINALTLEAQTALLRVMETQNLIRLGGQRIIPLTTRIMATSNSPLQDEVLSGNFRAELYYRLSILTIDIPPLAERGDDLLLLIDQILEHLSQHLGKQVLFSPEALAALRAYQWPGNIRELEVLLERLMHLTEHRVLTLDDLPFHISHLAQQHELPELPTKRLYDRQAAAERDAILQAGRENSGHLGRTAERLGISRATLWRKMKSYGLNRKHFW
jgi:PAS domain S-box-containing protein